MAIGVARLFFFFFFSSRRRHTRCLSDWTDVCSSDLPAEGGSPAITACWCNRPVDSPRSRRRHHSISEKCTRKLRTWIRTNATNICGPNLAQCFSLLNEKLQKYCQLTDRKSTR